MSTETSTAMSTAMSTEPTIPDRFTAQEVDDGETALSYRVSGAWALLSIGFWLAASVLAAFTVVVPLIGAVMILRAIVLATTQEVVLEADALTLRRRRSFSTEEQTLPLGSITGIATSIGPLADRFDYGTITVTVGNDRTRLAVGQLAGCRDLQRRVRARAARQGRTL